MLEQGHVTIDPSKSHTVLEATQSTFEQKELDKEVRLLRIPKTDRQAARNRHLVSWILLLLSVGVATWFLVDFLATSDRNELATGSTLSPDKMVGSDTQSQAATLLEGTIPDLKPEDPSSKTLSNRTVSSSDRPQIVLESRGYVLARHQVLISPQVTGRILKLNIEEGRRVVVGDVLAEIENVEYRSDYDQMRGAVIRAEAELRELVAGTRPQEIAAAIAELEEQTLTLPKVEADYRRHKQLVDRDASTLAELEAAESSYLALRRRIERLKQNLDLLKEGPRSERIDMAKASIVQAQAALAKAQWRLDNCVIRAPLSGTILRKNAEEGNLINAAAFNGSFSICEISDLSDLEVDLDIQERDISKIYAGQVCEVRSEAFPKHPYEAVVSRIMPIADRAKGAIPVRVAMRVPEDEQGVYLKPEMSALVVFYASKKDDKDKK